MERKSATFVRDGLGGQGVPEEIYVTAFTPVA